MPLISIIIPTRNNEEHIAEAITSCLDNKNNDYEIIIVNDASTDQTLTEIKKIFDIYPQKTSVITTEENIGLGPARNLGVSKAKGDYLMFLDGDDWFEPGAIDCVSKKLQQTQADVLMFNHQRVWNHETRIPNIPNRYIDLNNQEKNISEPTERKGAIRNLHSACNKAYKLDFIIKNKISFPKGFYEDITWSFNSVIKAKKIYFIPEIIFNYRQRWGSITRREDDRHFDIFEKYRSILKLMAEKENYRKWYGDEAYEYGRSQIFGLFETGYRIPKRRQSEYLRTSYKLLNEWRKLQNIKYFDAKLIAAKISKPTIYNAVAKVIKFSSSRITR